MKNIFKLFGAAGKTESFEILTPHTSGTRRVADDYEIVMNGDNGEISQ